MPERSWLGILSEDELLSMVLGDLSTKVSDDASILDCTMNTDSRRRLPALFQALVVLGEFRGIQEEYDAFYDAHRPPPPPENQVDRGNGPGED
jgi:hypothetical protein